MSGFHLATLFLMAQFTQASTGELHLALTDLSQLPVAGEVELVSEANQVRERRQTDDTGLLIIRRLPFGTYQLIVSRSGFAPFVGRVEIRSALPTQLRVTLNLAPVQATVTIGPEETLLDPRRTTSQQRIGAETIRTRLSALPGRSIPDLVNTQPGWLLEANGILHPRGSEYQTQYVIDGLPLTDNRSPAFAPEIEADDVHAMTILTGGYPAEYGRKLGGIIEIVTGGAARKGLHGSVSGSLGSHGTKGGAATIGHTWRRTSLSFAAGASGTDRFLDPPVEENFTNHGTTSNASVHAERDVAAGDRVGVIVRHGESRFLVPNERVQEEAGQRQIRNTRELAGQFSYQHLFSPTALADVRAMARDLAAGLSSNDVSTPIAARQDRGITDLYVKGALLLHRGLHEWKAGGDVIRGSVRERFGYAITDRRAFDGETPLRFAFDGRGTDREESLFVQDLIQGGRWTLIAGARWDHYRFVVEESAFSPRLSMAWSWPDAGLAARASYDRAFQTPAVENLLLSSSPDVEALGDEIVHLPVRPSVGDFYETGVSKTLGGVVRVDGSYFRRAMANSADDELLLNTGVSFPIAFRRAVVSGLEVKIDLPRWRTLSASAGYTLMRGTGALPITGGLFLGSEAEDLLASIDSLPLSQDQRHTVRGRLTWQLAPSAWAGMAASYDSGLPVEFEGDRHDALGQHGERIVSRVDLDGGRVRSSLSLDGSLGVIVAKSATRSLRVQIDGRNLTNRLNLINFSGLFSGTALALPRTIGVRLRADF